MRMMKKAAANDGIVTIAKLEAEIQKYNKFNIYFEDSNGELTVRNINTVKVEKCIDIGESYKTRKITVGEFLAALQNVAGMNGLEDDECEVTLFRKYFVPKVDTFKKKVMLYVSTPGKQNKKDDEFIDKWDDDDDFSGPEKHGNGDDDEETDANSYINRNWK